MSNALLFKATMVATIINNRVHVNDEAPSQPPKQAKEKEIKKMHEHIEPKHQAQSRSKIRKHR